MPAVAERKRNLIQILTSPEDAEDAVVQIVSEHGWHFVFEVLRMICLENVKMSRGSAMTEERWSNNARHLKNTVKYWQRTVQKGEANHDQPR